MNQKIKELAEQVYGMDVHYDNGVFAELIIKKCVFIAETYDLLLDEDDKECCICRKVAWRIADNINSEFGIE